MQNLLLRGKQIDILHKESEADLKSPAIEKE